MSPVRVVSSARGGSPRRVRSSVPIAALAAALAALLVLAAGAMLLRSSPPVDSVATRLNPLGRSEAIRRAVTIVVDAGAAGARGDAALRRLHARAFSGEGTDELRTLTLRAARQQRSALLGATGSSRLVERTVPVGYQLTRFQRDRASVAVWTLQVAGPARGRLPASWWLTTRVDLAAERGAWRLADAVAVQGPTPRLVRAQQEGVGSAGELRGLLTTTRPLRHAP